MAMRETQGGDGGERGEHEKAVRQWVHCWMHGGGGLSDTGVLLVPMVDWIESDRENNGGEGEGEMKMWWLCKILQATYRAGSIQMRASSKQSLVFSGTVMRVVHPRSMVGGIGTCLSAVLYCTLPRST